ncbi:MAG: patatin family protein [Clostridia bacterium]|nr:patatin family protein [Clostridia bacterium]
MTPITAKTGLILEGGAMRGMYTAGVCDVLMEQNITFDGCIGVSAGATFGCNFKSRQIGRTIRYNTKYSRDPRYASFRSLLFTGNYFGTKLCYDDIPNRLDPFDYETYQSNPMPFYIVCTDADTGEALYHRADTCDARDLTYMRASASMPLFSRIVEVDGYHLSDGGTADSIPLAWFRKQGYARNLIVLTRPEGYRKSTSSPAMNALLRLSLHKYPALAKALEQRHIGYNRTLDEIAAAEQTGDVLVLRPSRDLHLGRIEKDPDKLREMYNLGRSDAEAKLAQIRAFIAKSDV